MKNYYQILNVKPTATEDEIKRSYRVLAKRYHPDVNPGDESAADRFADINEANAVLSDPTARAQYDAKLKEAAAPKPNPEDIIARQRAQAQAAARQAARQAAMRGVDPRYAEAAMARAQQRERIRQAQMQQAAGGHAAFGASSQSQVQAQLTALRNQAFQSGHEQGMAEAQAAAEKEISRLNANLRAMLGENRRLKRQAEEDKALKAQLDDAERDRRELEQELFNRDRELSQEQLRSKEMEEQLSAYREAASAADAKSSEELENCRAALELANARIRTLEQEIGQSKMTNTAQIQLQQDKRKQMQEQIDALNAQVAELSATVDELRAENEQWEQYAKSEEFLSDAERRLQDWYKKTKADRRLAKTTLYGTLGVLIWATDAEIDAAYGKLVKRYSGKSDEAIVAKLAKVKEAYAVLCKPETRAEYNESIGITPEKLAEERRLIAEFEQIEEDYRSRLASKEFWAHYDELNTSALSGDAASQNALGEMYYYGDELEQDLEQAVFWFKEAAKQKHADGMYNLGVCFVNGEGVEQNKTTGYGFIRQASKLGSKAAKQYMDEM